MEPKDLDGAEKDLEKEGAENDREVIVLENDGAE